jgi:hypothetical protein
MLLLTIRRKTEVQEADGKTTKPGSKPRRATKRGLAQRDLRLIEKLAAGTTIEEIAASEGISLKWARERKAAVLASRVIDTPHEFIKLQIRRLSEAMLVSYSAMSNGDLKAVDKVIKVARELDRYHGFRAISSPQSFPEAPVTPSPLALLEPPAAEPVMGWNESEPGDGGAPRNDIPVAD